MKLTTNDPLLAFYREEGTDDRGRSYKEILAWTNAELEVIHDYIQWLFPLPEPSGANPSAPVLSGSTIAAFRADRLLRDRLRMAYLRMLALYGLAETRNGVEPGNAFAHQSTEWLSPGNHNHLRLTRMLRSLRLLGLNKEAERLFACLSRIYHDDSVAGRYRITPESFAYWTKAATERLDH